MKHTYLQKILAGALAFAVCALSGCSGNPDNKEDPLSGHNVDSLLPFGGTRVPEAVETATPTPTPNSTAIVGVTQGWQNESAPAGETPSPSSTTRVPQSYSRLEQGDEGEAVLRLQNRLNELGYLTSSADGKFGANTKTAVKLFQQALGLSQTGVATVSLQEKLFLSSAPSYAPSATATPNSSASSTQYQALVRGDTGNDVKNLQTRLIALNYLSGKADGQFGANTEKAVKAFQAQLGLSQTGVASVSLQQQLFSSSAPYASSSATASPTPAPTNSLAYEQLEPGDTGEQVVRMQNRLKSLGYFTGTVTGNYYKETTASVRLFQGAVGLSQTGIASSATLTALYASSAPVYSAATTTPTQEIGYTSLSRGSKGTEVKNLQKRLIELGYMTGSADGDFGSKTETAVKLFQQTVGYSTNGVASVGLQNLLFSANAPVYVPTTTPTPSPTAIPVQPTVSSGYRQLEPGDSGDAVKALQTRLKQLGFFSGAIGGNYLTKTTDAVRLFQAAIGHAKTGIATPEMQEILFSDNAPDYSSVKGEYVTLEKLDSGVQVLYLQQRLIELGYLTGSADGDFGSRTETAVKAFQKQAGLEQTGKATAETQTLLFSSVAPYAPVPTQIPTAVPTVIPTVAPTVESGYVSLSYGDSGTRVSALQERLLELGYFNGEIGGNYLAKTETAVKLFQAAVGYQTTGVASSDLQSLLFSSSAPYYDGAVYIQLSKGDEGPAVKNLQKRLIELGYLSGSADGDFGSATENAIKLFQAAVGYQQNGVATAELQEMLFSGSAPTGKPTATQEPVISDEGEYHVLSFGDEGDEVYRLQVRLIELGYLTDSATGNYRAKTEAAVKLFQQALGYSGDGVATAELQELLYSPSAPYYVPSSAQTPNESEDGEYRTLSQGDTGDAVKALQQRLKDLGFFDGDVGGNYLTKTEAAVKRFQKALGLTEDGIATPALQKMLFSSDAPSYTESTPTAPAQSTKLTRGDSGEQVEVMQNRLIELGWMTEDATGYFGEVTENALNAFLYRMGLPTDGVASEEALSLLYAADAPAYVEYTELQPGISTGQEVLNIQLRLIELGYLNDTSSNTDGIYGDALQNALIQLQLASGTLPELADGIATVELQTFLFSENAALYAVLTY